MRKRNVIVLLFVFSLFLTASKGHSCTSFYLAGMERPVVGKNYDWSIENGLVIVNKRGVQKTAAQYRAIEFDKPVKWKSKFGSITFNQFGRELPMGGINEAGLVVEVLMLTETVYPEPDSRPSISALQWVQYQLDNFSTIQEVVESNAQVRILQTVSGPGLHYFVCDRDGNSAIIEFLNGRFIYYTDENMPVKVLTNSTYEHGIRSWNHKKHRKSKQYAWARRFVHTAELLDKYSADKPADPASESWGTVDPRPLRRRRSLARSRSDRSIPGGCRY